MKEATKKAGNLVKEEDPLKVTKMPIINIDAASDDLK